MISLKDVQKIVVIGAGTMGAGIAQLSAMTGYQTVLFDTNPAARERALSSIQRNLDGAIKRNKIAAEDKPKILSRIDFTNFFDDLKGEIIIEAIVEKEKVKVDVFNQLAKINPQTTIFATNTSSIPITNIAAKIPHPERVVGMHFFNPAHIMKLVEVISGVATHPEVAETVKSLAEKMGKKAVMAKDAPGFIVNRVARHFYVESLQLLEEGLADATAIDQIMRATGFRMGAFELMDLIGIDTNFAVTSSMYNAFHQTPRFRPSRIQEQKVAAGHHGRKSGQGFYTHS